MAPGLRRARAGVAAVFFLTGAVFATWASRIPAVKEQVGIGDGALAVAFAGLNLGAVAGLQLAGRFVPQTGSKAALRVAVPVYGAFLAGPALARDLPVLVVCLAAFAMANSEVDVAMNAHGVLVENGYGRGILSGLHAMHSLGMIAGAGTGALAAHAGLGAVPHFLTVSVVAIGAGAVAIRPLLSSGEDAVPGGAGPVRGRRGMLRGGGVPCSCSARWPSVPRSPREAPTTGPPCTCATRWAQAPGPGRPGSGCSPRR